MQAGALDRQACNTVAGGEQAGAVLRLLLSTDPVVRLLIDALMAAEQPLSMRALVVLSAERDRALAPAIFFHPEAIATVTGEDGQILWHNVLPHHFRSTTFLQYKSVLKHAGIIAPHALGGSSARAYDPDPDLWELAPEV